MVVADVEDRAAPGLGRVLLDQRAGNPQIVGPAVGVDRAATTASRSLGPRRVGAAADGIVVADQAVEQGDGRAQPADRPTVGTVVALAAGTAEGAVHDVHRVLVAGGVGIVEIDGRQRVLGQHPDRRAAQVGTVGGAGVPDAHRVHDLESAAEGEDRAAPVAVSYTHL